MDWKKILGDLWTQELEDVLGKKNFVENGIPKHRFDEVNEKNKQLTEQIDSLDNKVKALEKSEGDVENLKQQLKDIQAEKTELQEKHEQEMAEFKQTSVIESKVSGKVEEGYEKLIISQIDRSKVIVQGEEVIGLDEQLALLEKQFPNVFLSEDGAGPDERGRNTGEPDVKKNPWMKETWNMTEQGRLLREEPELASRYKKQANKK